MAVSSFGNNYTRAMFLALLQIAFLAALGCTVSAAFSTPVAAFVAVAYLVIGLSIQAAITAPLTNDDGSYKYKNVTEMVLHKFAQGMGHVIVSVDDLDATSDLIRGRLIENRRLFNTVGPRQTGRYGMVVPRFVSQALAGQPLTVYGDVGLVSDSLGLPDREEIAVVLCGRDGKAIWLHRGPRTAEAAAALGTALDAT